MHGSDHCILDCRPVLRHVQTVTVSGTGTRVEVTIEGARLRPLTAVVCDAGGFDSRLARIVVGVLPFKVGRIRGMRRECLDHTLAVKNSNVLNPSFASAMY